MTVMPRRTHRKSRNGCLECKRRHIKCDEKHPLCGNCRSSERVCEYADRFRSSTTRSERSTVSTPTNAGPSPSVPSPPQAPVEPAKSVATCSEYQPFNMVHAELLFNLTTETIPSLSDGRTHWMLNPDLMRVGMLTPYLLNELLAISALHYSIVRPAERECYRRHAAQLQTHALEIFSQERRDITQETCVPLFLFSSVLGLHMLCDTIIYREENSFDGFLDQFVHYLKLHRGVRAVTSESWEALRGSILQPMLQYGQDMFRWDEELGPECRKIMDLIEAARLGEQTTSVYRQAVRALQISMHATGVTGGGSKVKYVGGITGWPVIVDVEYIETLELRRPEALVILACYGVVLHQARHMWAFGDGGRFLIEVIAKHLGPQWEGWLEWPTRVLRETQR
ncbi:Zn(II)2Cys6 transcription factor domain-containing protein [Aspergillus homomorphus CBS 101889]|uniref:Zn(2)-C6 fungal-type domain-containing protein n=1 Tax=Aspergillus homomorphus (strain CBS 101889) TaxID=1450537 RepID=A0A395I8M9_ASPHC|nr:hypothetical protein BO97DRAFT_362916 [Aspergillus homomorphus CBS 101889]RAL15398.1 hypothetical protein BO97DRAFT_362916 [Aspergillus homomorphus CBS 101889]